MRVRHHVNPLGLHFERFRGVRPELVPGRAIEVEIGCAEAQFLFERAAQDPSRTYVGLEIREDLVAYVNKRASAAGLPIHAVFCQAQLHLVEIFGAARADRIYINFPDPWFKRRQHSRRIVNPQLVDGIAAITSTNAEIFIQTDIWDVALDAMAVIERDERFINAAGEWSFWRAGNPYGVRSGREQHAEAHALPIWRILYRRGTVYTSSTCPA